MDYKKTFSFIVSDSSLKTCLSFSLIHHYMLLTDIFYLLYLTITTVITTIKHRSQPCSSFHSYIIIIIIINVIPSLPLLSSIVFISFPTSSFNCQLQYKDLVANRTEQTDATGSFKNLCAKFTRAGWFISMLQG